MLVIQSNQLRGLSIDKARLYGMPHIGCRYTAKGLDATAFAAEHPRCACCGRTNGSHNRHHEPPRSNGTFRLETQKGTFELRPALIDLCGSGTTGCHGDRHNGRLRIRWEWDTAEAEHRWWSGYWLSQPEHEPNGQWLFKYGRYIFTRDGVSWEYRRGL